MDIILNKSQVCVWVENSDVQKKKKVWIAPYGSLYIFSVQRHINIFICPNDKTYIYLISCHKSLINTDELVPILCHEHFGVHYTVYDFL